MRGRVAPLLGNVILLLLTLSLLLGLLELSWPLVYRAVTGYPFDAKTLRTRLAQETPLPNEIGVTDQAVVTRDHVLHPYLGFVQYHSPVPPPGSLAYVNSYGFTGIDPIQKRGPDRVIVGIFGGSVANILYLLNRKTFVEELGKIYPGRLIKVVCGAVAGYKQPQQLLGLTYLLALGGEFDVVINVDGFNEIALPYEENVKAGVNPFFPRSWNAYARKALDKRTVYKVSEIGRTEDRRRRLARLAHRSLLSKSALGLTVLEILDKREVARIKRLNVDIQEILQQNQGRDFQTSGPSFEYSGIDDLYERLVAVWSHSSLQMARLGRENGFRYFHFLQPNQYDPGSKVLTKHEIATAYAPDHPWRSAVERGYPLLRAAGARLREQGVGFSDLSGVFRDVDVDIYSDACCHYNEVGNAILARAIMSVVVKSLEEDPLPGSTGG